MRESCFWHVSYVLKYFEEDVFDLDCVLCIDLHILDFLC